MLIVPDAESAVAWYKDALGATELWNLGGVASLEIDGAPFYLHEVNRTTRRRTVLIGLVSLAPGSKFLLMTPTAS
jgi:catechol 2,3-dioxygenase-like lactoylglutathione lyase family enzyme